MSFEVYQANLVTMKVRCYKRYKHVHVNQRFPKKEWAHLFGGVHCHGRRNEMEWMKHSITYCPMLEMFNQRLAKKISLVFLNLVLTFAVTVWSAPSSSSAARPTCTSRHTESHSWQLTNVSNASIKWRRFWQNSHVIAKQRMKHRQKFLLSQRLENLITPILCLASSVPSQSACLQQLEAKQAKTTFGDKPSRTQVQSYLSFSDTNSNTASLNSIFLLKLHPCGQLLNCLI